VCVCTCGMCVCVCEYLWHRLWRRAARVQIALAPWISSPRPTASNLCANLSLKRKVRNPTPELINKSNLCARVCLLIYRTNLCACLSLNLQNKICARVCLLIYKSNLCACLSLGTKPRKGFWCLGTNSICVYLCVWKETLKQKEIYLWQQ